MVDLATVSSWPTNLWWEGIRYGHFELIRYDSVLLVNDRAPRARDGWSFEESMNSTVSEAYSNDLPHETANIFTNYRESSHLIRDL